MCSSRGIDVDCTGCTPGREVGQQFLSPQICPLPPHRLHRRRRRQHRIAPAGALAAAVVVWGVLGGSVGHAEVAVCRHGISRATTERLFAALNHSPAEAECKFQGVDTDRARLEARWSYGGRLLPPVVVVPRACAGPGGHASGPFVVDVPPEVVQNCPSVGPIITTFLQQVGDEAAVREIGSADDPLFRGARALFAGIVAVAVGLLARGAARRRDWDARWIAMGIAGFSAALALRGALPFSLGNWYSDVMPAAGPPPWMRFGPGYFAFQSLLRDAGIWSPRALILSQLLLGAAAVPLLLGVLWELRIGLEAAAATLVLLIFAPFHARLSATASEHVLASTLCVGLLLAWLRAARTGDRAWFGLTVLLFPAVCATRVDMTVQASLVVLWPLLRDRTEREGSVHGRSLAWRVMLLGLVAVATVVSAYVGIALPSHHPMPEPSAQLFALRVFIPELWRLATGDPPWVSLPAVLLAIAGVAAMAVRRPRLLVRIAATLALGFGAMGRTFLPDELVGARYFLFTIPIFLIASGQGFEAVLALVPARARAAVAASGIVGIGLWSGLAARPAYQARFAFQDEYTFLRGALARLPAGCTVFAVPMRADAFPRDLDCCLDLPRSPLVLDYPRLEFRSLPDALASVFESPGCAAYYESIACEIRDDPNDPSVHDRADRAADYLQQRCSEVRHVGRLETLAEVTTSPRATVNFFHGKRPHAGLYRWTPP
jgi:MFS family permease